MTKGAGLPSAFFSIHYLSLFAGINVPRSQECTLNVNPRCVRLHCSTLISASAMQQATGPNLFASKANAASSEVSEEMSQVRNWYLALLETVWDVRMSRQPARVPPAERRGANEA